MAMTPPMNAIHRGIPGGSVRPSSSPVMAADPSRSVPPGPSSRSLSTHPSVAAITTSAALGPNQ